MPESRPNQRLPIVFHHAYKMDIGDHVFAMDKYALVLEILQREGYATEDSICHPEPATPEQLSLVHTPEFLADFEAHRMTPRTMFSELPLSSDIVEGFKLMAGGTILAARLALDAGVAMHIGGGFHHAFADHAEGFCYLNDIAIAIRQLRAEGRIQRAAVIDVDLHQGNGTAQIFSADPDVFTFSIHQEDLYPAKQKSNIDIGLPMFTDDQAYLEKLGEIIPARIAEARPDLVVYVAGADPFERDQLGNLSLTMEGLRRRDELVAKACRDQGWPMVAVLAGGYAPDKNDTARIHANTAVELARAWGLGCSEPNPEPPEITA